MKRLLFFFLSTTLLGYSSWHLYAEDSIPETNKQTHKILSPVSSSDTSSKWAEYIGPLQKWESLTTSFSIQSDLLFSLEQDQTNKSWLGNSYIQGTLRNNFIELGARFEDLSHPLPGRSTIEAGRGIPFLYLSAFYNKFASITIGDFYERFGGGTVLRAYEDRALGIDNAIRGVKATIKPWKGITIKGLWGQQRYTYDRTFKLFNKNRGYISGADLDLDITQWSKTMQNKMMNLSIGASFVNKSEPDEDIFVIRNEKNYRLNLPHNVQAVAGRLNFGYKGFIFNTEYAYKPNDPTAENNYIYHPGSVALFSLSYSKKGMSALLQAKRSENFNFISKRSLLGMHLHINHMPPFSAQHTYALATLYPYATQPAGEWAFQGEFNYKFARNTFLGGKYGSFIKINFSHIRGLKKQYLEGVDPTNPSSLFGTDGYTSSFFGMGDLYFSDIDVMFSTKVNKVFNFSLSYLHQIYNQEVVEGHLVNENQATPHIWSNIFIYDGSYKLSKKTSLRTELQFLFTRHAEGHWVYGLAELSISPNWMLSISDQYNMGVTKKHYLMGAIAYAHGSHRIQLSAGSTRAGMNCSGGVCRWMPQTKGIYLSYNGNF